MKQYKKFDQYLIESLKDTKTAKAFLDTAIYEFEQDGHVAAFMLALRYLAEAKGGINVLSEKTQLNRQNLYKILTSKTTPRLDTTLSIMKGLGYPFRVSPIS